MFLPNVTWGEMRAFHRQLKEAGLTSPDDVLADPQAREESSDKADSDYVYEISQEEADYYEKLINGEPIEDIEHAFTVSDSDEVLEFIRTNYDTGQTFVRVEEQWVETNPDKPNPRIIDQILLDVKFGKLDESTKLWDNREQPLEVNQIIPLTKES